jgi:hypothetical protein
MSDIVLDRIQGQIQAATPQPAVISQPAAPTSPAVSPEALREALTKALIPEAAQPTPEPTESFSFENIYEFADWYVVNEDKFSPAQQIPLKTLVATRDMVNVGCACKRGTREAVANEYFVNFWRNNVSTDLMPTLLAALNTKRVLFARFMAYP